MGGKSRKLVRVVDGSDFARVYLKYGLERLVEEGELSLDEISGLDDGGEFSKKLLGGEGFRRKLERAGKKKQ
ncbi:MAG: hypothetical protein ABH851_04445 [Methanobacteriota archaeon]